MGKALLLLVLSLGVVGCVNQNTWRPTVDPYNDPNSATLSRDEADCRRIAHDSSGNVAGETAKGTAIGAGVGAAAGAIIGAIAGVPGTGAAIGAAAGGTAGGGYKAVESSDQFKTVFKNCMRERGHNVLD
jgi:uncharacterized protein YcfJ